MDDRGKDGDFLNKEGNSDVSSIRCAGSNMSVASSTFPELGTSVVSTNDTRKFTIDSLKDEWGTRDAHQEYCEKWLSSLPAKPDLSENWELNESFQDQYERGKLSSPIDLYLSEVQQGEEPAPKIFADKLQEGKETDTDARCNEEVIDSERHPNFEIPDGDCSDIKRFSDKPCTDVEFPDTEFHKPQNKNQSVLHPHDIFGADCEKIAECARCQNVIEKAEILELLRILVNDFNLRTDLKSNRYDCEMCTTTRAEPISNYKTHVLNHIYNKQVICTVCRTKVAGLSIQPVDSEKSCKI